MILHATTKVYSLIRKVCSIIAHVKGYETTFLKLANFASDPCAIKIVAYYNKFCKFFEGTFGHEGWKLSQH